MDLEEAISLYLYLKDQYKRSDVENSLYHLAWETICYDARASIKARTPSHLSEVRTPDPV